jgi:hypothetical protein
MSSDRQNWSPGFNDLDDDEWELHSALVDYSDAPSGVEAILDTLIPRALTHPNFVLRNAAVFALGAYGKANPARNTTWALGYVAGLLMSENALERESGAHLLKYLDRQTQTTPFFPALLLLRYDSSDGVSERASNTLKYTFDPMAEFIDFEPDEIMAGAVAGHGELTRLVGPVEGGSASGDLLDKEGCFAKMRAALGQSAVLQTQVPHDEVRQALEVIRSRKTADSPLALAILRHSVKLVMPSV